MARIETILEAIEEIAPRRFAFDFDHIGLQVGDPSANVDTAVVSLDRSLAAIEFAEQHKAQLLLSHHPLIWDPLKSLDERRHCEKGATRLVRAGINFIAAHTNWDCARGGINDSLASRLGLEDVKPFGSAAGVAIVKLIVFAPEEFVEKIIEAVSEAGAGRIGDYFRCAYMLRGEGTFVPGADTHPAIGKPGEKEVVPEVRFEMLLPEEKLSAVTRALRTAHPYEEPAYDVVRQVPSYEQPVGRLGRLDAPRSLADFAAQVGTQLATSAWVWGDPAAKVNKVAVVGGAADGEWMNARNAGADVLVTGEVKQNVALEASESGLAIIAAGHYATEQPGCAWLRDRMAKAVPGVEWLLFEPLPGKGGRPL